LKRRTCVRGSAGLLAAAASGWPRWAGAQEDASLAFLWQAAFLRPDGSELVMGSLRGTPLVLNFWGTWCPPCVQEMPELDRFQRDFAHQGWRVLGLAVDNPSAVREFLARRPVGYTIALAGLEGTTLTRRLGNGQGGLPYTVVIDRRGLVARRKRGQTQYDELAGWARAI
jgi:thiol-disulfide isomerase/thioredoxin